MADRERFAGLRASLFDVNLHYYWLSRGMRPSSVSCSANDRLTYGQLRILDTLPTSLSVQNGTLVLFADCAEFNIQLDQVGRFPAVGAQIALLLKRPTWGVQRYADGQLFLSGWRANGKLPGLSAVLARRLATLEC